MRRADRLFQLVQILRRGRVTTAAQLAHEIEVSERTIYRDVSDLIAHGIPIEGEAGVGYVLPASFDLPPLMFDAAEVEALVVGARMVSSWADADLARAAKSALTKIESVLPERSKKKLAATRVFAPDVFVRKDAHAALSMVRAALESQRVITFEYTSESGERSQRRVQPLGLFFWGRTWTLAAWCETRSDFRNFRVDRMTGTRVLTERFDAVAGRTLEDFLARVATERERDERPQPRTTARTQPSKVPKLDLDADERVALRRAGVKASDVAHIGAREFARRVDGALSPKRCAEIFALADFQQLGSVGLETARDFVLLGFERVEDLVGRDPVELYERLSQLTGARQDPCVEDVVRCAIAQAEDPRLPPDLRDWWKWTSVRGQPSTVRPSSARPSAVRSRSARPNTKR